MTFIKFCGITNYQDAKSALDLGVDALGFNFVKASSRYIEPMEARTIIRRLPAGPWYVGVFVNSTKAEIDNIARSASLDAIQLHGDETLEFCRGWNELKVIKALRLGHAGASTDDCEKYKKVADYLLIDHYSKESYGGTGKEIESNLLDTLSKEIFAKTFLSGGLNPQNVASKIKKYQPFAVDVASGIEQAPGVKSLSKMQDFVEFCKMNPL